MNSTCPHVLVVGAGPAGLVAALALLQNGIPVRIIDKDPNPRIGQRGPGIQPRSVELFNFLNVSEVNDLGTRVPIIRSYKPGTLEILKESSFTPYLEPSPAIPFTSRVMGQQLLDTILRRHLEKFSCSVEMGTELRSFEQSEEGVTAVLAKNGTLESFDTKWMIGADGAKGVVRKQLGLSFLGETRDDTRIITGDIRLNGVDRAVRPISTVFYLLDGRARAPDPVSKVLPPIWKFPRTRVCTSGIDSLRLGDALMTHSMLLRPTDEIGEDGWQFVIFDNDIDMTKVTQSEELIFEIIASVIPTEVTFNKLVWVSEFRANIRMVDRFNEGRVFVAGDAAHVHSLTGGQGLNSSVQDAFNLGWKLALVEKGLADKSLLETYSAERLPVISEMLNMTTSMLNKAITSGDISIGRSSVLFMLGINYRFSSIVLDEYATPVEGRPINAYGVLDEGHLEAGDRAPDAPNMRQVKRGESDMKTLFSLYRPWYHTVIVFAPSLADSSPILGALEAYDKSVMRSAVVLPSSTQVTSVASHANLVLVDEEGYAYSAYLVEAGHTKVFVIRPDGVIGAIVHGAEGVKKYFSGIFLDV